MVARLEFSWKKGSALRRKLDSGMEEGRQKTRCASSSATERSGHHGPVSSSLLQVGGEWSTGAEAKKTPELRFDM